MDNPVCNICLLDLYQEPESYEFNTKMYKGIVTTKCNHAAHIQCVNKWLGNKAIDKRKCSLCMQPATPLSYILDHGLCDRDGIQKYFENEPLCACNPGSINTLQKFLQTNPSFTQNTFQSKEFDSDISLLMYAVLKGHTDVVQMLIHAGANVNQPNPKYKTPIFQAIHLKNKIIGRELINAGATINLDTHESGKLLFTALKGHHEYVIDGILTDNNNDDRLKHIMLFAIKTNCPEALNRLIKKGIDIDSLYKSEATFLHEAVNVCSKTMVLLLGKNMRNIDALDKNGNTALYLAVNTRQLALVKTLINFSANHITLSNALLLATQMGDEDIVKLLLEKTSEVHNPYLTSGKTLYTAVNYGHENLVKILCTQDNQNDVNYVDPTSDCSTISKAVTYGKKEILEILCSQNGANLNSADKNGYSPLLIAALNQRLSSAEILLKYGADPNLSKSSDTLITPIALACQNGDLDMVEVLIKYGAKVDTTPGITLSPLYIATQYGCDKIVDLLLKHGAKTDIPRVEGATALMLAAQYGCTAIVKLLLDSGANIQQKAKGYTALQLANKEGHPEVVKLLLEKGADSKIQNKNDHTAFDVTSLEDHQEAETSET